MTHRLALALAATFALGCADQAGAPTGPAARAATAAAARAPGAATMRFGAAHMNGFAQMAPSALEHTAAGHMVDKVYPHTVAIDRGQTVTFESLPVHQIAVYGPGTAPADIRLDPEHLDDVGDFKDVLINDPANRRALSPISFEPMTWTPDAATFAEPGRYLVVCTVIFHYVEAKMYGWVEVR